MSGVRTEARDGVLEITIDRPKANAIDSSTSIELGKTFASFRDDPDLRVAIITGAGEKFFSAGWDMKAAAEGDPEEWGEGGFAGLTELWDLDKPVIAAINGIAVGGGFELALACDLMVCVPKARMWLSEVNLGFVADAGGVLRLPQRLPRAIAMEMLLTAREMGAEEALRWGLVNRVAERDALMDTARGLAADIVAAAPMAIRATKQIVTAAEHLTAEQGFTVLRDGVAIPLYQEMLDSRDAHEGPAAFAEGRDPEWKGR